MVHDLSSSAALILKGSNFLGGFKARRRRICKLAETRDEDEWVTVWLTVYNRGRTKARDLTAFYSSAAFHPNNQKDHYPARSSAFRDGEETYKNEQKRIIRETIRRAFHSPIVSQTSALSIDIALNYFPIISLVT